MLRFGRGTMETAQRRGCARSEAGMDLELLEEEEEEEEGHHIRRQRPWQRGVGAELLGNPMIRTTSIMLGGGGEPERARASARARKKGGG